MSEYKITIEGYNSGLTEKTVEQQVREMVGGPDVTIEVTEVNEDGKFK